MPLEEADGQEGKLEGVDKGLVKIRLPDDPLRFEDEAVFEAGEDSDTLSERSPYEDRRRVKKRVREKVWRLGRVVILCSVVWLILVVLLRIGFRSVLQFVFLWHLCTALVAFLYIIVWLIPCLCVLAAQPARTRLLASEHVCSFHLCNGRNSNNKNNCQRLKSCSRPNTACMVAHEQVLLLNFGIEPFSRFYKAESVLGWCWIFLLLIFSTGLKPPAS